MSPLLLGQGERKEWTSVTPDVYYIVLRCTVLYCVACAPRYLRERRQFGAPLASFQLMQEKLARMLGNVNVSTARIAGAGALLGCIYTAWNAPLSGPCT
jgi:hypothetical protein